LTETVCNLIGCSKKNKLGQIKKNEKLSKTGTKEIDDPSKVENIKIVLR
jgi:hypothetical protein